jgi:glycosyltransferase involved in cell wall biosynthesis
MKINTITPFFSVIIPTLNEEKYLPRLLNDLAKQTFKDFEVIIVDAKSKDKTRVNANEFKNEFKKFQFILSNKKNVAHQRNLGVTKAKAKYIIFFDADVQMPSYFMQGIKYQHEKEGSEILSSWFTPNSNKRIDKIISLFINLYENFQKKKKNPYLLEQMVLFDKRAFNLLKGFDESLHNNEGNDLLKRALNYGMKFRFVKEPKWHASFRRLRKLGYLKVLRGLIELEYKRFTNKPVSFEHAEKLYPMKYDKNELD